MMTMQLSEAARVLDGHCRDGDVMFRGVSTDSRRLQAGNLFVALQGPNFDGHDYLDMALAQGAAAAAVSRKRIACGKLDSPANVHIRHQRRTPGGMPAKEQVSAKADAGSARDIINGFGVEV